MAPQSLNDEQGRPSDQNFLVQGPSLTLPKGGGALRGIGEKFAANPVTGTGTLTLPIAVSPGRAGFAPQLTLSYDSGSGNGPFGLGWNLSLPSITRRTDRGLPQYQDAAESDVFILSGAEDLVPVLLQDTQGQWTRDTSQRDGYSITSYRPRIEGLFSRIERWTRISDGDTYWRSISRDNITTLYGSTSASRIVDPLDPTRIFTWLIAESRDDKGNAILYEYAPEDSSNVDPSQANERNRTGLSRSANRYLKRIKYGNLSSFLVQPDITRLTWLFEVVFDYEEGGSNVAAGSANAAKGLEFYAGLLATLASMSATMGSYRRRADEWKLQADMSQKELDQINQQIDAAQIRAQIAQTEIDNQNTQISNAQAVEDTLRSKYTNQDLYAWMISQTSQVFFQCYQLAYDMAKRAEKAFRFERGLGDSSFITFGYWDNLKKGLLSGEQLYLDLRRLEMAYLDQNKRDYEIGKRISLMLTAPMALIALKEIGQCTLDLPEPLFDADYPGHFMRRVKSVSLTTPCVTGPYTSVNCTLTLFKNATRVSSAPTGNEGRYTRDVNGNDPRFVDDFAAIQSIATSSGQNDSGMFEVNFRDERYLPFEGAGVISTWQLDLPKDTNAFDFETISDLILNVNYTARDGCAALRHAARAAASQPATPAPRLFSLKHEFPSDWYKFLTPPAAAPSQVLTIALGIERFPFLYRGKKIAITKLDLHLRFKDIYDASTYRLDPANPTPQGDYAKGTALTMYVTPAPGSAAAAAATLQSTTSYLNGLPHAVLDLTSQPGALGSWLLEARDADIHRIAASLQTTVMADTATHYRLKAELIEDIILVCTYQVQ
jgi:hypothetical protein